MSGKGTFASVGLVAASIVLLLLAAAPSGAAQTIDGPPRLSIGDGWTYEGSATVEFGSMKILQTFTVEDTDDEVTIEAGTFPALRLDQRTTSDADAGVFTFKTWGNGTTWLHTEDHGSLRTEMTTKAAGGPLGEGQTSNSTTEYDEPCPEFAFPLEVGKTWEVDCTMTVTTDGSESTQTRRTTYEVLRSERVTVPAGTFDALVIQNTTEDGDGGGQLQWYAAKACGQVKMEVPTGDGGTFTMELQEYTCASGDSASGGNGQDGGDGGAGDDGDGDDGQGTPAPGVVVLVVVVALAAVAAGRRPVS